MLYRPPILLISETDSRLTRFAGGFRNDRAQFDSGDIVLFVAGLVVVFGVLWLIARWSERRVRTDSSLALFWTLAKTHELSWSDCWLLWRITRSKGVTEPALLFLDPRLTSPQFLNHLTAPQAARLKILRRRFFFGIDETVESPFEAAVHPLDTTVQNVGHSLDRILPSAAGPGTPANESASPMGATGDLAEALGAISGPEQANQPTRDKESFRPSVPGESPPQSALSAEFPEPDAPVLDLYPWLGSDWEITNADE
jgi:hypothetical protein